MSTILTAEGKEKVIEELDYISSYMLPQVEENIDNAKNTGEDIKELIEQRDFYKERIPYLENLINTAKVVGKMKYFETHDPYYALIKAKTKKEAIRQYTKHIADDEDGSLNKEMKEVGKDYALILFARSTGEDLKYLKPKELLKEFNDEVPGVLVVTSEIS